MYYRVVFVVGMRIMNKINILYEDNHIIVVVKQANVPVQEDSSKDLDLLTMIKQYLKEKYNKPGNVYLGLVHRLDRPVSGVMVFAKTSKAASRLSEQIRMHNFKKKYAAVVHGILNSKKSELVNYIVKDKNNNSKICVNKEGKLAKLKYCVLDEDKDRNLSLVDIDLETGRHHQIRVQFACIGHFLYGDQRYGVQDRNQLALIAYGLEFVHPVKKEYMKFKIEIPKTGIWKVFKSVK